MKRFACALLTISTVLVSSSVALADDYENGGYAESGSVQTTNQITTIEGKGNTSIQTSRQVNKVRRGQSGYSRSDVNVQDINQDGMLLGDDNINDQYAEQINQVYEGRGRENRRR